MIRTASAWLLAVSLVAGSNLAIAQEKAEDVVPGVPFKEGDIIGFEQLDKLKDYLPPQFWKHREYFFYEGMQLEIGPSYRDYTETKAYGDATEKYASASSVGRDGALAGYVAGRPFPGEIDCKGDPEAGQKIIWNFMKRWNGEGANASYFYS